jgi:hypothetical protein
VHPDDLFPRGWLRNHPNRMNDKSIRDSLLSSLADPQGRTATVSGFSSQRARWLLRRRRGGGTGSWIYSAGGAGSGSVVMSTVSAAEPRSVSLGCGAWAGCGWKNCSRETLALSDGAAGAPASERGGSSTAADLSAVVTEGARVAVSSPAAEVTAGALSSFALFFCFCGSDASMGGS